MVEMRGVEPLSNYLIKNILLITLNVYLGVLLNFIPIFILKMIVIVDLIII